MPTRFGPRAPVRPIDRPLRLLHPASFFASVDRLLITPLLIPLSLDLGVPLTQVAMVVTVYYFAYGVMQVVWGFVSDRIGRVRTVRIALALAALAGVVTALATGLPLLLASRALAGVAYAAVIPGSIIYIGDTLPADRRHGPLTDLMTATAVGIAAATLVGGALADLVGWRATFALPSVCVAVLVVLLRRVPEPRDVSPPQRPLTALASVLGRRWPLVVLGLVFVEGMMLLGVLTYLPTLLQSAGMSPTMSGVVTATYGASIIGFAALVKHLGRRWTPAPLIAVGGLLGTGAYVSLVISQQWPGVLGASVLLAGGWAFMHTNLQTWSTEVAPAARSTAVSLFASCLFLGSAAWTALGAEPVASGDLRGYLVAGLVVMALLGMIATVARHRYRG